jgi:arylsulfatase A-like enzyme
LCACSPGEVPPPPESWRSEAQLLTRLGNAAPLRVGTFDRGEVSRHGVWLPAGSEFAADVTVPDRGFLEFTSQAVDAAADGAPRLQVDLRAGAEDWQPLVPSFEAVALASRRVDLAAWAGRELTLRFRVEGPADGTVFVGEPAVFAPSKSPRRVVLLFVDTLRPDHLGFLGYDRDTSPRLDALASESAVFEVARAPAPWTLPSARSALSGRQPETWEQAPHLAERLAAAGFATLGVASNAFLGPAFGMGRGFTEYQLHSKAGARAVVDRALSQLEQYADRDALLLVHFMDPHLPYREPEAYQGLFDRSAPELLGASLERKDLLALNPSDPGFERERRRIVARYDQTIRYLDDELARLLDAIGPDATVVLFSDHGEEFWEHGGAEHGHTLFDEVLRVPLLVRDPALPPGRHTVPASLLDIAPTLLELLGLPPAPSDGVSLVGVARGEPGAVDALAKRPEAFGRMLYGGERWSVRTGPRKWSTWAGRQVLVDLSADPEERRDLSTEPGADLTAYVALLGETLDRDVHGVWRVLLGLPPTDRETVVRIRHPDGIAEAWPHPDPLGRKSGSTIRLEDGGVELRQPAGATAPPTLTLVPRGSADQPQGLEVTIESGDERLVGRVAESPPPFAGGSTPPLLRIGDGIRGALVLTALAPRPLSDDKPELSDDVREALRELGYLE